MENWIKVILAKRWIIASAFVLISLIGVYAWKQLVLDAYPDISDVTVNVVTQVSGLAAEEMEQQVSIPLERALNGVPHLRVLRGKNTFGLSSITLVFDDQVDDYWARQRVAERIHEVDLPYNAQPQLGPLTSPIGEIYRYMIVSNNHDLRALTDINKWTIIPRLRQISGVADVSNFGGITTQFQVEIDPDKLNKYDISLSDVTATIDRNNTNAGGSLLNRGDLSYVIRGIGLVKSLDDIGNIVIKTVHGVPVYLSDVGTLKYGNLERKGVLGYCDKNRISFSDGVEGIVQMLRGANPSQVLQQVHQTVDQLNNGELPEGVFIHPYLDRTELVNTTLGTVEHTLLFGMLLVISVLILFLGSWRGALIVAIAIPFSMLVAFVLMYFTHIPANLLSLGAIDFGILVDGSIVMLETILKKREDNPQLTLEEPSIIQRIKEVAKPIFFSTLIIIIAYLPLFAFERIEKKLFTPMAFTIGYALIGALLAALILIPGLAYALYRKPRKVHKNRWIEYLIVKYKAQIIKLLHTPKKIIFPILLTLASVVVLWFTVGKDFLPKLDEGGIWMQVQMPSGISLNKGKEMSDNLRKKLIGIDEITYVMTQTGRDDDGTDPFSMSHVECAIGLKPYKEWKRGASKEALIQSIADSIATMPGYVVGFSQPIIDMVMDQIAGSHSDLAIKIFGDDLTQAHQLAGHLVQVIKTIHGAQDVAIDQEPPLPQLQIIANRDKIARYGLNVSDVSELIEVAIGGKAISQVFIGSKSYDIICRYTEASRNTPEKIKNLQLTAGSGAKIALSQVADVITSSGASTINREMGKRYLTVRVNLRGTDLSTFMKQARRKIKEEVSYDPAQFNIQWDGQLDNQQRAYSNLAVIVPVVLAIMFLMLYFAFGNAHQAGLLMSLLPIAMLGGILALNVRGMTFNVSSAVGFIALFGLIIQNGVIMITHINDLRSAGHPLGEAVITGTAHRFRPILLTALVAILGLLPASLSSGIGSDIQKPLATVIVYGLLFGTLVTLYILPTLYYVVEQKLEKKKNEAN